MTLRIGLVGAGYWAAQQHAPMHDPMVTGTELVGVWAREPGPAAKLAARHGVIRCASFDELLEVCDAVDFAIPPAAQVEYAVRAAQAGKHLLLEKPVAGDLEGARRLTEVIGEHGVKSVLGLTRRFHPTTVAFIDEAHQLAARGQIMGAQGMFLHNGLLPGGFLTPGTWRSEATGPLLDLGAHIIDIALAALGPVESVRAVGGKYTIVELYHSSSAATQLAMSMHVQAMPSKHELHVYGTEGVASFSKAGIDDAECWRIICRQLSRAAEFGESTLADAFTGLQLQRVLDAAIRSIKSDQVQAVPQ